MQNILTMIFYIISGCFTWIFSDLTEGFSIGYIAVSVGLICALLTYFLRKKDK